MRDPCPSRLFEISYHPYVQYGRHSGMDQGHRISKESGHAPPGALPQVPNGLP